MGGEMKADLKRKAFVRPAGDSRKRLESKSKDSKESKSRDSKRKPSSIDDHDVHTIRPRKSQGQSKQNGRARDRSHRPSYDFYDTTEVSEDSDEEFAPFAGRAGPGTDRIHSERIPDPKHPPRHSKDASPRYSSRDISVEPPPRSAGRDQPRRNQSSGRHRRERDSSTDSYQSPPPPRRRAKSRARHDRDRSRSLDYQSKPRYREYARPIRDPPNNSAALPRSATFPSQNAHRPTTDANHNFKPSSRSQTFPNLNGQSYNSTFTDPMFPGSGQSYNSTFNDPMSPGSGGFQSFTSSYTSPSGYQSYTTNTFDGASPFKQSFFSGGPTPRTPRTNPAFFPESPGRTSQYEAYPQSSPNAHGPSWEGKYMDDLLKEGDEYIDQAIRNAERHMQRDKSRAARRPESRYDWTGPNHKNNDHDQNFKYDDRYNDKPSQDHGQDHTSSSHQHDWEHFQKQRERARSQARSHKHGHTRAPSPVKDVSHDYYATLGISPAATLDEIRAAAKRRRIATHPDKCKKPHMTEAQKAEIDEEAKRVGEAAVILTDKNARASYDYEYHMKKRFGDMRM